MEKQNACVNTESNEVIFSFWFTALFEQLVSILLVVLLLYLFVCLFVCLFFCYFFSNTMFLPYEFINKIIFILLCLFFISPCNYILE